MFREVGCLTDLPDVDLITISRRNNMNHATTHIAIDPSRGPMDKVHLRGSDSPHCPLVVVRSYDRVYMIW